MPTTMTISTMATLIATMTEVTRDDSLIPRMSTQVITATMNIAGMLNFAVSPAIDSGRGLPRSPSSWLRYPDQPTATVAAPRASSSTRSQPMIQATISPSAAQENGAAEPATGTVEANSA